MASLPSRRDRCRVGLRESVRNSVRISSFFERTSLLNAIFRLITDLLITDLLMGGILVVCRRCCRHW
jgi:hypothetical protein